VSATGTTPTPAPAREQALPTPVTRCLDCGAPLAGKFCGECGQRAQLRSVSLATLAHDVIHDLGHVDSRVWRTLRALLLRPGYLTNEFLAGRRTRYLPPFRLYLVLSIIFFVLLSCNPPEEAIVLEGADVTGEPSGVVTGKDGEALSQAMDELSREMTSQSASAPAGDEAAADAATKAAAKTVAAIGKAAADADSSVIPDADCGLFKWSAAGHTWFEPGLDRVCEKLKTVSKREFGRALFRNVPKMMFFFLPLLAFVNLLLYAFRRRKYVEHLLFYTHFHAFAFLVLILQMLLLFVLGITNHLAGVSSLVKFATIVYLFVALFMGMRQVYRQSRLLTAFKYVVVLITYGISLLLTFVGTIFYTALTV